MLCDDGEGELNRYNKKNAALRGGNGGKYGIQTMH